MVKVISIVSKSLSTSNTAPHNSTTLTGTRLSQENCLVKVGTGRGMDKGGRDYEGESELFSL
jgi:hypothetical protein